MNDQNPSATPCVNPATGEVFARSPLHSLEDLRAAMEAARQAQPGWAALPPKERARRVLPIRDRLVSRADELARVLARDNGKTLTDALATEILPAAISVTYYARMAPRFLRPRRTGTATWLLANKRSVVQRVPWGVVGIISPWNYPFGIPFHEVVMALLAGNAVLLKTASETQAVGVALAEVIGAADLPKGLFSFLNLPGRVAGPAFLETGVDKLFFTGSVPVGKALMAKAAETLTPLSLELGGNDPMLVCEDADVDRAAAGAVWAGMQNAGQSCGGVERIYVHEKVYSAFLQALKARVEALRVGPGEGFENDMGAMTTAKQLETVREHVRDALAKGAVLHAQSSAPEGGPGLFHPAVVLAEVNHDMVTMREETFGPVVGVMKVKDMEEAVALANDSNLGLTASVWSRNRKRAKTLASRLHAGAVTINDHLMSHGLPETPWGGFKQSSLGRTHGQIGFDEMTQPRVVVDDLLGFAARDLWWHPHGREVYEGLKGLVLGLYARSFGTRLGGWLKALRILPRMFRRSG
ncbi:MAG: aldehyde dehydrogenase family protein [Acidobacteriota bacterium]